MKCPKCQFDNPDDKKFCRDCGAKLPLVCPQCALEILPSDKFCGECGYNISIPHGVLRKDLSFDEKLTQIQRYLPRGLTEKILSQRDRIEGERKQVTVMFCDMEGFTKLSEKLGLEEAYKVMDQVYEILIHKVHRYEGTVNEMTGDGIMALFGAPNAIENARQRAIQSAIAIHKEIALFSIRYRKKNKMNIVFQMRIGIHAGRVIVGLLGNDLRVEFKAVGDTVNIASRLEKLAEPGTTYVSKNIFKHTKGLFQFEALGEKCIKGIEKPLMVFKVISLGSKSTRFDVNVERGLTPLTGRQMELNLLLENLDSVKQGSGRSISIVAEAGMGKSRLLYEFKKYLSEFHWTFIMGRCLSYHKSTAFYCIAEVLKTLFGIHDDNSDEEIIHKTRAVLEKNGLYDNNTVPFILELLSIKASGIEEISISQEAKRNRLFEAFKNVMFAFAKDKPLVLVFEDLQWVDKASIEIIRYLFKYISGLRLFLILTYRPDFAHTWETKSYYSQITLSPHSKREILRFLNYLFKGELVDPSLEQLIVNKTEGNPFFIEEFVKSMLEFGIIEKVTNKYCLQKVSSEIEVPSNIQDVIMARVDILPEPAKELIQLCAAIEREFSYELIEKVFSRSHEDLMSLLSILLDQELIYVRGAFPHSDYVFRHSLIREVIYNSILSEKKKKLHEKIAEAIISLYGDKPVKYYGLLAEHYLLCGDYEKAIEFLELAVQKEVKAALLNDAIYHANKKISALEHLPQSNDIVDRIIDARVDCSRYLFLMNYMSDAKSTIDPIIEIALKKKNKDSLCQIYMITGAYYCMVEENFSQARKYLIDSIKLADESGNIIGSLISNYLLGLAYSWECKFDKTFHYIEKALKIFTEINSLWGIAIMKSLLSFYALNYQGNVKQGYQTSLEAFEISKESDDILSQAMAYTCHGISCFYKGKFSKSEKKLRVGAQLADRINLLSFNALANHWLGVVYHELKMYEKSKIHFTEAMSIREQSDLFPSSVLLSKMATILSQVAQEPMVINYSELYRTFQQNKLKLYEGKFSRYLAKILLISGTNQIDEAINCICQAINSHKRYHMLWDLGIDYFTYAEILKRKKMITKSKEIMIKAKSIFKNCGAKGWAQKVDNALAEYVV
ncbi:MAG: AAA family ATPase [bacterium]|nr:MAG: AAA family ATPase [bacterium]